MEAGFGYCLRLLKQGLILAQGLKLRRKHLRQLRKPQEEVQAEVEMKVDEGRFCSTI
jgi:hypothetical protein